MKFKNEKVDDIMLITLDGRLEMSSSNKLKKAFADWQKSTANFVFDCRDLEFLDSTGLGVLLLCLKKVMKRGGDIRLSNLNESVRMVMEITRGDDIFRIFPTAEDAVASFRAART